MMLEPVESTALENLVTNMLGVDETWLTKHSPTNYSYWQYTLETRLSSQANDDGSIKLRAATLIATNIKDAKLAERVCASLNYLASSWSFAYDYADQTIKALSSLNLYIHTTNEPPRQGVAEPQPFLDAWFTIFTNIIWAQNAMSADLAESIAKAVQGKPAFSKPNNQTEVRKEPDVFNHIPEVLRQRPEWVVDVRPYTQWPNFEEVADHVLSIANEELESEFKWEMGEATETSALLAQKSETGYVATLGINHSQDFRYGETFSVTHPVSRPDAFSGFELANRSNLFMFELGSTTQFGNWRYKNGSIAFVQNIPSAFVRCIESSSGAAALSNYHPVFFARLTKFALDIEPCLFAIQNSDASPVAEDELDGIQELAHEFIKALEVPSAGLLSNISDDYDVATPNPLVLRGESLYNFFTIPIFNPMGPTIHSLEAYATDGDDVILVETMRHPYYPAYLPSAKANPSSPEIMSLVESSIERMFNDIPSYLYMDECPEEIIPTLNNLIKAKLLKLAHEQNVDIEAKLTRLKELNQSPWQRIDHDLEPIPEDSTPATKEQVDELFDYITSFENTILFWNHIPDAWDGSLNNASSNGFIDDTNVGPLVWIYNGSIGSE
jgi:hypothetical protein